MITKCKFCDYQTEDRSLRIYKQLAKKDLIKVSNHMKHEHPERIYDHISPEFIFNPKHMNLIDYAPR